MYRTLFLYVLLLHFLGDFILQTDGMAENKKTSPAAVLRHSLIYAAPFALLAAYWSVPALFLALALAGLHLAVDYLKFLFIRSAKKPSETAVYCLDQTLHLLLMLAAVFTAKRLGAAFAFPAAVETALAPLRLDIRTLLQWAALLLFISKPANITVKTLTANYRPPDAAAGARPNAGALIGTLERIVIALLLSVGQYAAIGLVLTAKSVARYEKLKDQAFAEYYLLGTLLSALLAIAAYLVLFTMV